MERKKYKQGKRKDTRDVSEPQAAYSIDVNAFKLAGINALLSIDNPIILEKVVDSLLETAAQSLGNRQLSRRKRRSAKKRFLRESVKDCWR